MDLAWGIDVSHWQGAIDWPAVERSGLAQFAAVRLTVGLKPDERWQANLAGAADHVPLAMAYAVVGTKAAQADAAELLVNMVDRVSDISRVALVVDAEKFRDGTHPNMTQVHQFRDALQRLTGRWPSAYIPDWFMTEFGYRTDSQPWPWWPSRYVPEPWGPVRLDSLHPQLEHGFRVHGPWQFTSSGSVAGISTRVDRNVFFGSLAELRALTLGGEETDMPLTDADIPVIRKALGLKTGEEAASSTDIATLLRGDPTHPDNLKAIRGDLDELGNLIDEVMAAVKAAGVTVTDAQAELIGAKVALAVKPPAYTGTLRIQPEGNGP